MADYWSNLLEELLDLVAQRLTLITDYHSFGAVCVTWRSVALRKDCLHLLRNIPVLMIPNNNQQREEEEEEEEEIGRPLFYSPNNDKGKRLFYSLNERVYDFEISIPPNNGCCGSDKGWLVTVDDICAVRLVDPFSRDKKKNEIQLPPLTELPFQVIDGITPVLDNYFLQKAFLSSNPSSTLDFVVLVIFGGSSDLAFCRPGDKTWTLVEKNVDFCCDDAIFYKKKFHVVNVSGKVMDCDVFSPHPSLTMVASSPTTDYIIWEKRYLVESLGELLQVQRILDEDYKPIWSKDETYKTHRFNVYKLLEGKWVDVKSLCDRSLFIGHNTSLSLLASDFPGCMPNCIYFTDDYDDHYFSEGGPHNFGIFNLEDQSIEPLFYPIDTKPIMPPPIWILPAL